MGHARELLGCGPTLSRSAQAQSRLVHRPSSEELSRSLLFSFAQKIANLGTKTPYSLILETDANSELEIKGLKLGLRVIRTENIPGSGWHPDLGV